MNQLDVRMQVRNVDEKLSIKKVTDVDEIEEFVKYIAGLLCVFINNVDIERLHLKINRLCA